jgi:hypothetical protein
MKLSEKEIRDIIREELKNLSEQQPGGDEKITGPGAMQIKKAEKGLNRIKNVMAPTLKSLENLGLRARVNFALHLLEPLNLQQREIVELKKQLDKKVKK